MENKNRKVECSEDKLGRNDVRTNNEGNEQVGQKKLIEKYVPPHLRTSDELNNLESSLQHLSLSGEREQPSEKATASTLETCCLVISQLSSSLSEISRDKILQPFTSRGGEVRQVGDSKVLIVFSSHRTADGALNAVRNSNIRAVYLRDYVSEDKQELLDGNFCKLLINILINFFD